MIKKMNKCFKIGAILSHQFTHMMHTKQIILQNTPKTLEIEMGKYLKEFGYDT